VGGAATAKTVSTKWGSRRGVVRVCFDYRTGRLTPTVPAIFVLVFQTLFISIGSYLSGSGCCAATSLAVDAAVADDAVVRVVFGALLLRTPSRRDSRSDRCWCWRDLHRNHPMFRRAVS